MPYTPTSSKQRDQWNAFIHYLRKEKISGSKSLDKGKNPTKKLLEQYRSVDPEFSIQPEDVGNIQYEMNQFKETGKFPGYKEGQKALGTYKKYADTKQFSKQDNWIGSQTSQQFFPSAKTTLAVTNPQGVTTTQSQDYGSRMDDFATGKDIDWNQKSKSKATQTTVVGTEGMDVNRVPTPPSIQNQPQGEIQKGIPITGRKVKLGSQILGTYNNGVFVPASGLTGNAARITSNKATLNEFLLSNGYASGETKIASSFEKGGQVKKKEDSNLENILEILDPTGISSWDDVYRSAKDPKSPWHDTAIEVLGALPLLGKAGKLIKGASKIGKGLDGYIVSKKMLGASKGVTSAAIAGKASDVGQAYDEYKKGGMVKCSTGGTPYGGYFDQRTDAGAEGTRIPNAPVTNYQEYQQQPQEEPAESAEPQAPTQPKTSWGQKTINTIGAIGNGVNDGINILHSTVNYFNQQKKQREFDKAMRDNMNTDGLYGPGATGTSKGDYVQSGTAYGQFQPDKRGNFTNKGMTKGAYYPGFAMGGTLVPDGYSGPGETFAAPLLPEMPQGITTTQAPQQVAPEQVAVEPSSTGEVSDIQSFLLQRESSGNYAALPWKKNKDGTKTLASSAVGGYQFLWDLHKDWIMKVTGVSSKEEFRKSKEAQDKAFHHWDATVLTPEATKIAQELGRSDIDINAIKAQVHFAGPKGARDFYLKGKKTTDAFGTTNNTYAATIPKKEYKEGGEYEMSEEELIEYMKNGGEVEFL